MLGVNKEELVQKFKEQDWDYVFKIAYRISEYLIIQQYKINDYDVVADMAQECCLNLYKKVLDNKIDENKNIFSFIWANSNFRILEILRKERKRKNIALMISYDNILDNVLSKECIDDDYEKELDFCSVYKKD